jgi:hypothetical protein
MNQGMPAARWYDDYFSMDDARAQRIGRALDQKIPKLRGAAAAYGSKSMLILESNDIGLSNAIDIGQAFKRAIEGRSELPDIVILVETEGRSTGGYSRKATLCSRMRTTSRITAREPITIDSALLLIRSRIRAISAKRA